MSAAELVEALRPVADAVSRKDYTDKYGDAKRATSRIELHLSVAECQRIMRLVEAADIAQLIKAV